LTINEVLSLALLVLLAHLVLSQPWAGKSRGWVLLILSVLALFWLQPAMPLRWLDYWLPVLTLFITILSWLLTSDQAQKRSRLTKLTLSVIAGLVLMVALTRFLGWDGVLTATRPPPVGQVLVGILVMSLLLALLIWKGRATPAWQTSGILLLLIIFVFLKLPALTGRLSMILRGVLAQSTATASALDIRWLGFSYVAFRLIHTLRDRQAGRLDAYSLRDYVNYVIFFPSISAGPIDRIQRFQKDINQPLQTGLTATMDGLQRFVVGLFKKYAIADTLALIALNSGNAGQLLPNGWAWLVVYAYAFQIYFDFGGYTDIAIGFGKLLGVNLPENFNRPYLKPNLTQFWNNWHITLTQWFRAYFFNPFTRALRTSPRFRNLTPAGMILVTQISTMVLIGLWHGITLNFVLWGVWHGLGLFFQNRYSDWARRRLSKLQLDDKPLLRYGIQAVNVLFTFNYVALGWIWFALPDVSSSLHVFGALFGVAGGGN
jgi:alginate O-acetyltransferase complex protein AlgI